MIRFVFVTATVLACVCDVQAEECFISQQPSMEQIPDSLGVLRDSMRGRALSILVNDLGREASIQVEFVSLPAPFDTWNGFKMFARAPVGHCPALVSASDSCVNESGNFVTAKLECTTSPFTTSWGRPGRRRTGRRSEH